eukprot:TRINITY_DN8131_c0_g1_i3.p1 TRINITY_DN8131_c0_g1~~TRINITY_DN8131_c0_g1_i3.p1  ORF type:complete len:465 (+),score=134.09 TRINITY_DN8131_c0_g1_i3:1304-2698(+)
MSFTVHSVPGDNVAQVCKADGVKRWLESERTLCELSFHGTGQYLALAHRRGVAVVQMGRREAGGVLREKARVPFRRFSTLSCEGDVTAMHWVRVGRTSAKVPLLLLGTSNGVLLTLSYRTALLHRQKVAVGSIVSIHHRRRQDKLDEVLVLAAPNVLVSIDASPLVHLSDAKYVEPVTDDDPARRPKDSDPFTDDVTDYAIDTPTYSVNSSLPGGLACTTHKLMTCEGEAASVAAIAPVAKVRSDPFESSNVPLKWVIAAGKQPSLGAYKLAGDETQSTADSAWKVASAALSFAKVSLLGRAPKPKAAAPVTVNAEQEFQDTKREFESVSVDYTGRYVAAADNLGRVAVVDTTLFTIVRLLKGYRQATVLWLPPSADAGYTFLVHLPRRGIIEVWSLGSQQRVAAATIGFNCHVKHSGRADDMTCLVVQTDGSTSTLSLSTDSKKLAGSAFSPDEVCEGSNLQE